MEQTGGLDGCRIVPPAVPPFPSSILRPAHELRNGHWEAGANSRFESPEIASPPHPSKIVRADDHENASPPLPSSASRADEHQFRNGHAGTAADTRLLPPEVAPLPLPNTILRADDHQFSNWHAEAEAVTCFIYEQSSAQDFSRTGFPYEQTSMNGNGNQQTFSVVAESAVDEAMVGLNAKVNFELQEFLAKVAHKLQEPEDHSPNLIKLDKLQRPEGHTPVCKSTSSPLANCSEALRSAATAPSTFFPQHDSPLYNCVYQEKGRGTGHDVSSKPGESDEKKRPPSLQMETLNENEVLVRKTPTLGEVVRREGEVANGEESVFDSQSPLGRSFVSTFSRNDGTLPPPTPISTSPSLGSQRRASKKTFGRGSLTKQASFGSLSQASLGDLFNKLEAVLASEHPRDVLEDFVKEDLSFLYKSRPTCGQYIHVAALHMKGAMVIPRLLELKASVFDECSSTSFNHQTLLQPLILASSTDHVDVLQVLIDNKAKVDVKTMHGGDSNYTALHEAAYFDRSEAMKFLLLHKADATQVNMKRQTPLHVAACMGAFKVTQLLVDANCELGWEDKEGKTALRQAVQVGTFPSEHILTLATPTIADVRLLAVHYEDAAVELLREVKRAHFDVGPIAARENLKDLSILTRVDLDTLASSDLHNKSKIFTVEDFLTFMKLAPSVAEHLLDAVTLTPSAESFFHHPLPTYAWIGSRDSAENILGVDYRADVIWKFDSTGDAGYPKWHDSLVPGWGSFKEIELFTQGVSSGFFDLITKERKKQRLVRVDVLQLRLQGVMRAEVFHLLSETEYTSIFTQPATKAILEYAWRKCAHHYCRISLILRLIDLLVLSILTLSPSIGETFRRYAWSILCVSSIRELFDEAFFFLGHLRKRILLASYFRISRLPKLASDLLYFYSAIYSIQDPDIEAQVTSEILALVIFCRWMQFMNTLRAFQITGQRMVALIHCFMPMGGLLVIICLTFLGFLHAFTSLDTRTGDRSNVMVGTFRFLFIGDDKGIDSVLELGGADENGSGFTQMCLVVATCVFYISLLNLFIAVQSKEYKDKQAKATEMFLQERAQLCLTVMLQPNWRLPCLKSPIVSYSVLFTIALLLWFYLLQVQKVNVIFASLPLLFAVLLGSALIVCSPGLQKGDNNCILWWCQRAGASISHDRPRGKLDMKQDLEKIETKLHETIDAISCLKHDQDALKVEMQRRHEQMCEVFLSAVSSTNRN